MRATQKSDGDRRSSPEDATASPNITSAIRRASGLRVATSNPNPPHQGNRAADSRNLLIERQSLVIQTLAEFLDQDSFEGSLSALVGELQHRFRSDRVAVSLMHTAGLKIHAISQQANIDPLSGEVRLLTDAMQEACEQDQIIHFPTDNKTLLITVAHQALTTGRQSAQVCTLPLCHRGEVVGALLFDLDSSQIWSKLTISLMRQVADIVTPLVVIRQKSERGVVDLAGNQLRNSLISLFKPEYLTTKCIGALIILGLLAVYFTPVTHQITTAVEIVPMERRVITAPQRGYIRQVNTNPGDHIVAGQVLLTLDTRDLDLERVNREIEIQSARTELRAAMAAHDRKEMALTTARLDQAQAQLDLIRQQIDRSSLIAPSDGTVVSGDLSQSLGAPVERGDTLFEIAPTDGYKAYLMVTESEVGYVTIGQLGQLSLKSDPGTALPITVNKIHPMAEAANGSNRFRVEASFDQEQVGLRPGQTGVGKLSADETNLLWVSTHHFTDWLRLHLWEWFG